MATDRRSFDQATSAQVQDDLASIVARLEATIADRQAAVNAAMADFQADGVSEEYRSVETRWNNAANEVRTILDLVRTVMNRNDDTASATLGKARAAVQAIG
jgi:hypothetical protein